MNDEKNSFTVKDRRHFTPQGESRESSTSEDAAASRAADARPDEPLRAAQDDGEHADEPVTFTGFLAGLAAQGAVLLGLVAAPGETAAPPDLRGARHIISVLEMLEDKTKGARTPEEDRIIDAILYELRMGFVKASEKEAV